MLVTAVGVTVSFIGAGLVASGVRPRNRVGVLLIAVGLLWTLGKFLPPLGGLSALLMGAWAAALAHLVVAFPDGRLTGRGPRVVVGWAYSSAAVVGLLGILGVDSGAAYRTVAIPAAVLTGLAVIGVQMIRWRTSTVTRRRLLGPVYAAAVVAAALFVTLKPAVIAGVAVRPLTPVIQLALVAIPLAYLGSLLRRRIDQSGVAALVVRLKDAPQPMGIERAMAQALHDPTIRVGYWVPESGSYVDVDGCVVSAPANDERASTYIDHDGGPLALLVHDAALVENSDLIEATCAAATLALTNERLTAQLRLQVRQLAESRSHVLRAAETERRRLERDLHDSVQQRLLSIPMTLSLAETAVQAQPTRAEALIGEARSTTLSVLEELRALSQGIHPPVLTERGLTGAVRELAALSPVPLQVSVDVPDQLPAEIETTAYYVVAEALANVIKHADASQGQVRIEARGGGLTVEVEDDGRGGAEPAEGSGLRGLADRVAANGGTLRVHSPVGRGTRICAELPCA
jgi:signal transduction histidine kinase